MPGHEFEKNVQQRLDELKLRPSEAVWKNVENNIRQERRRRRMILWLPILFLFLVTSGYLIFKQEYISSSTAGKKNRTEQNNAVKVSPEAREEVNTTAPKNNKDPNTAAQQTAPKELNDANLTKNSLNQKSISISRIDSSTTGKSTAGNKNSNASSKTAILSPITAQDQIVKSHEKLDVNDTKKDALAINDEDDLIGYYNVNPSLIERSNAVVSIQIPGTHNAPIETPVVDVNSLSRATEKEKFRSGKWQWGLDLSIGKANASSELSFLKSAQMDAGSGLGGNPSTSAGSPSSIEPGFYWAAGAFVQRNFSNWFALSSGLRYAQYSTRIHTGSRVDSSRVFFNSGSFATVSNYYRNGKANQYTNRYHFLELPVTAHAKLNKSNSFPVYANLGLSVAWLIGTNSLNYDGISGAYYYDDDLFNKTQLGLHGGFSFGVLNKSKYPLRIGPSFNYKLSGLMENASSNKHLLSFGVDFRVLLKK